MMDKCVKVKYTTITPHHQIHLESRAKTMGLRLRLYTQQENLESYKEFWNFARCKGISLLLGFAKGTSKWGNVAKFGRDEGEREGQNTEGVK